MEIDPRLQNIPTRADAYASVQSSSYTLNPIRLPQPQSANLPSLAQDGGHPYYNIPQDRRPQTVQPQSSEEQGGPDSDSTKPVVGQGDEKNGDSKRPRACEACRGLKVRCEPDPTKGTCRRCAKAGRQCVVTAPSRKRQKKTDTRVAELEKKIDALTASLHATKDEVPSEDSSYEEDEAREAPTAYGAGQPFHSDKNSRKRRRSDYQENQVGTRAMDTSAVNGTSTVITRGTASSQPLPVHVATQSSGLTPIPPIDPSLPGHEFTDVVDRKILDAATATTIFYHYTTNMAKHMPAVVFPTNVNAGEIRRTKPTLFLAILSVASGRDYPDIQQILLREVIRVYADSIVCKGEKSLELIQALQISSLWYLPEDHNDAKPYQLIHMAAVMAMAIGLGKKKRACKAPFAAFWKDSQHKNLIIDSTTIESRRAWLSCYAISANFAMAVRQPTLYRWNSYIDESVNTLENSPDAVPSDKVLCQWVRRQHLVEEVVEKFHTDELIEAASTSDPVIYTVLKTFEERLNNWRKNIPEEVVSLSLTLGYHVANLYVHQMGIQVEHSTENLDESRNQDNPCGSTTENAASISAPQTDALKTCLTSIHKVYDTFLSFTIEDIRTMPVLYFIRMAFATVSLFRIYGYAIVPDSELGKVLPPAELKVEMYLNRLLELLQAAAAERKSRPAQSFRSVLIMLKAWFEQQKNGRRPNQTELTDQELKLHAQPVDTKRNTPRLGYRKISMQTNKSFEDATRASTTFGKGQLKQEGQGLQRNLSHPSPAVPNMGNTPLDLLSQVAISDQSTAVHHQQLAINPPPDTWYPAYPDNLATHNDSPQIPYTDNNQPYYPIPGPYTDPTSAYNAPYQGLDPNQSLEQAIGMAFGGEGDFCGMMIDDGLLGFVPGAQVGFNPGYGGVWDGGGQ